MITDNHAVHSTPAVSGLLSPNEIATSFCRGPPRPGKTLDTDRRRSAIGRGHRFKGTRAENDVPDKKEKTAETAASS